MIIIVVLFFVSSVIITTFAGVGVRTAFLDSTFDSLQISYNLIAFGSASNPLILISKLLDAVIFPLLTVLLASWFFDFINNINFKDRRVLSKINRLDDHVIVVPYNSFARTLLQELKNSGIKSVTIVSSRRELLNMYKDNELAIEGEMRSLETFYIAGIGKAKCVIACSKDDIENALISITAKTANPHVKIIARANRQENVRRLERAGARRTIIAGLSAGEDIGEEIAKRLLSKRGLKNN